MISDFYDSVSGRAFRGIKELKVCLIDFTDGTSLAKILREADDLCQQSYRAEEKEFIPYFKIEFDCLDNGSNYYLHIEDRSRVEPRIVGTVCITYSDSALQLRYPSSLATLKNGSWNLAGLRLVLSEHMKRLDASARELIDSTLVTFAQLDSDHPAEFAFDIDNDDERLSIVARRNLKPFATNSFYH